MRTKTPSSMSRALTRDVRRMPQRVRSGRYPHQQRFCSRARRPDQESSSLPPLSYADHQTLDQSSQEENINTLSRACSCIHLACVRRVGSLHIHNIIVDQPLRSSWTSSVWHDSSSKQRPPGPNGRLDEMRLNHDAVLHKPTQ